MASNGGNLIQGIAACASVGSYLLYNALSRLRKIRSIADTPTSKSSTAPQGFIELQGFAWIKDKTNQTIEGSEALYYSIKLERLEKKGKKKVWKTVFEQTHANTFYVVDEHGLVEARINKGDLELDPKTRAWTGLASQEQERFLASFNTGIPNFPPTGFFTKLFSHKYRVTEWELLLGSPVYASGNFRTEKQEAPQIKSRALTEFFKKTTVSLSSKKTRNLSAKQKRELFCDTAQTLRSHLPLEAPESDFKIYGIISSSENHKLLIADCHQEDLLEKLGSFLKLKFAGSAICLTLAIAGTLQMVVPKSKLNAIDDIFIEKALETDQVLQKVTSTKEGLPLNREIATQQPIEVFDANKLHFECIAKKTESCKNLLAKAQEINLSPAHISAYRRYACAGGEKELCGDSTPTQR